MDQQNMESMNNSKGLTHPLFTGDMICAFLIVFALFILNGAAVLWLQKSEMVSIASTYTLSIQEREILLEEVMRSSLAEVEQIPLEEKLKILEALEADAQKEVSQVEADISPELIEEP